MGLKMEHATSKTRALSATQGVQTSGPDTAVAAGRHSQGTIEWRQILGLREMGIYYALAMLVTILAIATGYAGRENYLSFLNLTNVLYQSSYTAIMAIAMTVILISGNFDLSVGSVAAFSAVVVVGLCNVIGFIPAAIVAMLAAFLAGAMNGIIVQYLRINAFIVTLGTMTAIRGLVLIVTDGRSLSVTTNSANDAMRVFEAGRVGGGLPLTILAVLLFLAGSYSIVVAMQRRTSVRASAVGMILGGGVIAWLVSTIGMAEVMVPKSVIYMSIFGAATWFVLRFTTTGRRLYAVGGNAEAARLSGISVVKYKLLCFVLCSGAAGFAGILFASDLRSVNPSALTGSELTVIASAILGGTSLFGGAGSIPKTLAGTFLLYALTNGFNILNLGANYQGFIEGTVIVTAAAIYSVGGNRRRMARKVK